MGDTELAVDILKDMQNYGVPLNKYKYSLLLITYASAVTKPKALTSQIDEYVKDAWKLFEQI